MKRYPMAIQSDIVVQESGDETLVYNLITNRAYCLNETSAIVWKLCNGKRTVSDISGEMSKRMKILIDVDIVWLALNQLNKDGLLKKGFETNKKFIYQTRREAIKKIGFASTIALPIISSITAPKAANAQSSACSAMFQTCECPDTTGAGNTCGQGEGLFFQMCPALCVCTSTGNPFGANLEFGQCR